MDISFVISLLALGAFGGFVAGLLGVGGGMIIVPFLTFIFEWRGLPTDLVPKLAIATSSAMIVFTSMSSMYAHNRTGGVLWKVVFGLVPGIMIGGLLAGQVLSIINTALLLFIFSVFVSYSAFNMLRNKKPKPTRQLPGVAGLSATGGGIGFISGLVGAGGGFLSVPFMLWCNVSIRNAVSTSAALGFPIALGATIGNVIAGLQTIGIQEGMFGFVHWHALLILICMSMVMAPVGAKVAHNMPVDTLRKIFACLLFGVSLSMFYKALSVNGII